MTLALRSEKRRRLTLEEWSALDEDTPGELVNGLLEEEEVTTYLHELLVAFLLATLHTQIWPRGGAVFGSEGKVRTGAAAGRKPDLSVYFPGAELPSRQAKIAKSPPSMLIEVVTNTSRDARRDRVTKRGEYAAIGVPFYWLVDPEERVVEVLRLEGRAYVTIAVASSGVLQVPGCEGVTVSVDALWAGADRLSDDPPSSRSRRKKVAPRAASPVRAAPRRQPRSTVKSP